MFFSTLYLVCSKINVADKHFTPWTIYCTTFLWIVFHIWMTCEMTVQMFGTLNIYFNNLLNEWFLLKPTAECFYKILYMFGRSLKAFADYGGPRSHATFQNTRTYAFYLVKETRSTRSSWILGKYYPVNMRYCLNSVGNDFTGNQNWNKSTGMEHDLQGLCIMSSYFKSNKHVCGNVQHTITWKTFRHANHSAVNIRLYKTFECTHFKNLP